jgi:hypothetical protein
VSFLEHFRSELSCAGESEAEFIECCSRVFSTGVDLDPWKIIQAGVESIRADHGLPYHVTHRAVPIFGIASGFPYSLSLIVFGVRKGEVSASGFQELASLANDSDVTVVGTSKFAVVSSVLEGECFYDEYELTERVPDEIVSDNIYSLLRIEKKVERVARRGDVIVRSRSDRILKFNEQKSRCFLLMATAHEPASQFQFVFSSTTGQLLSIVDYDLKSSRKMKALSLLAKYGNRGSIETAQSLLDDKHHGLRWLAIKCLVNLDPRSAEKYISLGLSDRNQEIRDVCRKIMNSRESRKDAQ